MNLWGREFWLIDPFLRDTDRLNMDTLVKNLPFPLIENAPQTIPFPVRAYFFRSLIQNDKDARYNQSMWHSEVVEIRREFILEDAFERIFPMGTNIKNRFRIEFVDANYITEEGVDGGGLFKEFMTKLTEVIFNPQYSFFTETPVTR